MTESVEQSVALSTIAREWSRIGIIGFGGPPAHIALLRQLCVEERGWLSAREFEDGISATNLLPGLPRPSLPSSAAGACADVQVR
jgi:chromate transporter